MWRRFAQALIASMAFTVIAVILALGASNWLGGIAIFTAVPLVIGFVAGRRWPAAIALAVGALTLASIPVNGFRSPAGAVMDLALSLVLVAPPAAFGALAGAELRKLVRERRAVE